MYFTLNIKNAYELKNVVYHSDNRMFLAVLLYDRSRACLNYLLRGLELSARGLFSEDRTVLNTSHP